MAKIKQLLKNRLLKLTFTASIFLFISYGVSFAYQVPNGHPKTSSTSTYPNITLNNATCDMPSYGDYRINVDTSTTTATVQAFTPGYGCIGFPYSFNVSAYGYSPQYGDIFQIVADTGNSDLFMYNGVGWDISSTSISAQTRIVSLIPYDNSTTTSPVTIDFKFYISDTDINNNYYVDVFANNRGKNSISDYIGYTNNIVIASFLATTSGAYEYSTTTALVNGNYELTAKLHPCYNLYDITCLENPLQFLGFYKPSDLEITHYYIVGDAINGYNGTTLGNLSHSVNSEIDNVLNGGVYSSSTQASLDKCNPLGSFDIGSCFWIITIPNIEDTKNSLNDSMNIIFSSFPFGYLSRIKDILSTESTTSLPNLTINTQYPNSPFATMTNLTIDTNDILAGAGNLADTIKDPIHNYSLKDLMYNIVLLQVAIEVVLYIIIDLTKYKNRRKK